MVTVLFFSLTPDGCCFHIRFDYPVSQYTSQPDVLYNFIYTGTTANGIGYWVDENNPDKVLLKTGDYWLIAANGMNGNVFYGELYSPDTQCPPLEESPNNGWSMSFPHTFTCIGIQPTTTALTTTPSTGG